MDTPHQNISARRFISILKYGMIHVLCPNRMEDNLATVDVSHRMHWKQTLEKQRPSKTKKIVFARKNKRYSLFLQLW